MKKLINEQGTHLVNDNGAMIEFLGFEPSHSIETMCWYNPYVDVQVKVYDEENDFSLCFTINKYVVPEEYLPENWHDMSNLEIWNTVHQNICDNIENLNVLNSIIPLDCAMKSAIDDFRQEEGHHNRFWDNHDDEEISHIILDEFHWGVLMSNVIDDFTVLESECAVGSKVLNDYITEFKVEQK